MTPGFQDLLDVRSLQARYAAGACAPVDVLADVRRRMTAWAERDPAVWIDRMPDAEVDAQVARVIERRSRGEPMPLYGVPFAVKDNIDVAGRPTTAACPDFAYAPERSATVVQKLCDAGAILVGKTNLDQFATGLVGTRSPYGACRNVFDGRYISGGSSSGSAVAVAAGLVSFALGTDTAGSGRVPAAFNNIVGLKPTRGRLSTAGAVPACRSLDCVSVFALTCGDAALVADVAAGYDARDAFSRPPEEVKPSPMPDPGGAFRFGVPSDEHLRFFGDEHGATLFREAVARLESLGGVRVTIDYTPFAEAARLLYDGPWVAERLAAIKDFFARRPDALLPVTRSIIGRATERTAVDAFEGTYRLRELIRRAAPAWRAIDVLVLPTAGRIYTVDQVRDDPLALNTNLGYYTNFVNLMDLCGVAVPSAFAPDGLPVGISLIAPAGCDDWLLRLGDRYHRAAHVPLGATGRPLADAPAPDSGASAPRDGAARTVELAVVGAHLSGQPLNHQLTERGATLVRTCRTSTNYRLFALPGTTPPKPGLVRAADGNDRAAATGIEVEVWAMSPAAFGDFVAAIPPPLGIGTIAMEDGTAVKGFLCEGYAVDGARDITSSGGWRAYLKTLAPVSST